LSLAFHIFMQRVFVETWAEAIFDINAGSNLPTVTTLALPLIVHSWVFPLGFGVLLASAVIVLTVPSIKERMRWRVPAFRDASLAKVAGTMALLLDRSVPLPEAVGLMEQLESRSKAGLELQTWKSRLAQGVTRFTDVAAGGRAFPPLFVWLVHNAGADLAQGFRRASEIYRARAAARAEMMLHASLPVAVLVLGGLVVTQAILMLSSFLVFVSLLDQLGS
ncbi:MAG TPA: type II secretion system F family protein, partial [Bryobacteraceae bacterium]|nr:type II secretion system F family protein [Bryobacteraceae bacterium]